MELVQDKHSDRVSYDITGVPATTRMEACEVAAAELNQSRFPTAKKAEISGAFPTNEAKTQWTVMAAHIQRKS